MNISAKYWLKNEGLKNFDKPYSEEFKNKLFLYFHVLTIIGTIFAISILNKIYDL